MPNDTDHKIRVVAEFFEVEGWKSGQMCPIIAGRDKRCGDFQHYKSAAHEIPPPNLLAPAGAWALLVAMRERKLRVIISYTHVIIKDSAFTLMTIPIGSPNPRLTDPATQMALLDAAYQLATKEQQ